MSILTNALSGLLASRSSLVTTTNNISNANTEGYSRQRTELADRGSQFLSGVRLGNGVGVNGVSRAYTDLINAEINRNTSLASSLTSSQQQLSRIDSIISADGAGINDAFLAFYESAQDLSVRPTDIVARNSFLAKTDALVSRFNDLDRLISDVKNEGTKQISESVGYVNQLSSEIANLNKLILQSTSSDGQRPNELLDARDLAVERLAGEIEVQRVIQDNGSFSIFLKNGQPLVADSSAYEIAARQNPVDPEEVQIGVRAPIAGSLQFVSFGPDRLGNGKIGGLLSAQKRLDEYQNTLGLVSVRFAEEVNSAFENGFDLDGNPGSPLISFAGQVGFNNGFSQVTPNEFNADQSVTFSSLTFDSSVIFPKQFEVYQKAGQLYAREKGSNVEGLVVTNDGAGNYNAGDFQFTLSGPVSDGDSFIVSPVKLGAKNITVSIKDPYALATSKDPALVGDNGVMLDIVGLQSAIKVYTSSGAKGATILNAFTDLVNRVGNDKKTIDSSLLAQDAVLFQSKSEKDSAVGVNLDEEAANLIKFQQSYQAASQVISVERSLFEGLLNTLR